jgi:hypothetical protein
MDQPQSRTVRYAVVGVSSLALLLFLGWLILRESPPSPVQSVRFAPVPSSVSPPASTPKPDEGSPREPATNQVTAPIITNAAVFYKQAFALYDALSKEDIDLIFGGTNNPSVAADLCGKIQPMCDLIRQAAAVSNCDWGVEQPVTTNTVYPYLQGLQDSRNLARAAIWSVGHCRTNDASAAIDDLIATSRLGQNVSSPATEIGLLVDLAIQGLVAYSVAENASFLASADDSQLIDLLTNAHYDDELRRVFEQSADTNTRFADDLTDMPPDEALRQLTNRWTEAGYASFASQIQSMGLAQAVADLRQVAELEREYADALVLPDAEYSAWMASRDEAGIANPFVAFYVTPLERSVDHAQYATVISAMAAAGLAVMQDGPDALSSYPDPATGRPFTYTQTDDGFTLESGFQPQGNSQRWPVKLSFM